ncbi:unnamed protein product, partial [Brassica oleracea var. botrytis]
MDNDDGAGGDNRRRSSRKTKLSGSDRGGSKTPRISSRNTTTSAAGKAEHDPALIVEPMMEISGDHEDMWGLWDDENYDKKVEYMVQLLKDVHLFLKANWLGGDAGDPLFVYDEKPKTPKRKKQVVAEDEPVRKQRRISGFFRRTHTGVDPDKFAALEGRVNEFCGEVAKLWNVCEKQGRTIKRLKERLKGRSQKKYRQSCTKKTRVEVTGCPMGADVNLDYENNVVVATSSQVPEYNVVDVSGTLAQQQGGVHVGDVTNISGDDVQGVGVEVVGLGVEEEIPEKVHGEVTSEGISHLVGGGLRPVLEGEGSAGGGGDVNGASIPPVVSSCQTNLEEVFEGVATRSGAVEELVEVSHKIKDGEEKPLGKDKVVEEVGAKAAVASVVVSGLAGKQVAGYSCGQRTGRGRRVQGDRRVHENQTERGRDVYKNCEQEDGINDEIGSGDDLTDDDAAEAKEEMVDEEELAALLLAKSPLALQEMVPFYEDVDNPFFER